jgi:heme-degrading monooxygenase HmoA
MLVVIWEYDVPAGREDAFAALYGNQGAWVGLFREFEGYIGTELLRDAREPHAHDAAGQGPARVVHFMTIDRWTSQAAYDAFLTAAESRYAHIDARGDALTAAERCLGRYTTA